MKHIKTVLQRLRQCCALKGRKAGSSLGMVMIVGTALVIWVMAIMPLMTATGTTAINTQSSQIDYLSARSSIEFSKSELEKLAESGLPHTFVVIKEDDGTYTAIPKKEGIITNAEYQIYVNADPIDDTNDVPAANDAGAKVAAICAVVPMTGNTTQHEIIITTYTNGEKNLSFSAIYTLSGTLLIYPEAYKQSQALPLGDFILVDGKLGANEVWVSDIASPSDSYYDEFLLPWKLDMGAEYANAGEYPALFKKTAKASGDGENIGDEIEEGELTNQKWIMPSASTKNASDKVEGSMWIDISGRSAQVYMRMGGQNRTITSSCTIYYNGEARTTYPTNSGQYTISVDYNGTGEYKETSNAVNVLPIKGVVLGSYTVAEGSAYNASCGIDSVEYRGGSCIVNLDSVDGARYGYTTATDGSNITWTSNSKIELADAGQTYYFYCYCPAGMDDDGVWHGASQVEYAGMIFPFEAAASLEDGGQYLVMAKNSSKYYSLNKSAGATEYPKNQSYSSVEQYAGDMNQGVLILSADDTSVNFDNLTWTMVKTNPQSNTSAWRFVSQGQTVNGKFEPKQGLSMKKSSSIFGSSSYSLSVGALSSDSDFTISTNNGAMRAYRSFSSSSWWGGSSTTTVYLGYESGSWLSSGGFKASTDVQDIYFVKTPVQGKTEGIAAPVMVGDQNLDLEFTYDPNSVNWTQIKDLIAAENGVVPDDMYLNGDFVYFDDTINAGTYDLVGYIENDEWLFGEEFYKIGTLTVSQAELAQQDYNIVIEQDTADELKLTVTGSGWNEESGGVAYLGYRTVEPNGEMSDIYWFEPTVDQDYDGYNDTFEFRLDYGSYIFAMAESGTKNYLAKTAKYESEVFEVKAHSLTLTEEDRAKFVYKLDRTNPNDVKVTWYSLPEGIIPRRITMVYGTPTDDGGISWSETYTTGVRFYGAVIRETNYASLDSVFQLPQPLGITNVNNHFSSVMSGSELYFMGDTYSINTYGNDIYLTADLLVLKNKITGGGRVIVNPYSKDLDDPGDTLVFFVKAFNNFKAKEFYLIPSGTDLISASQGDVSGMMCVDEGGTGTDGVNFAGVVQGYFQNGTYPEISIDIAYAETKQLAQIVSGETIGWTEDGVLSGQSNSNNGKYAVCAYVSEVSGPVDYRANRVHIAAQDSETTHGLYVPEDMKFTTRYLSVDADLIEGPEGVKFELYNLGQNTSFYEEFFRPLGIDVYSSKTLQMDYARYTVIRSGGAEGFRSKQVCRYEDGTDILALNATSMPLLVDYTSDEIEDMFSNYLSSLGAVATTVDRYVQLKDPSGANGTIEIDSVFRSKLKIYANYLFIDSSIKEISFDTAFSLFGSTDVLINCQESGYTAEEYLFLFKWSTENYAGTLVYIEGPLKITVESRTKTVEPGFYFIYATENGTSLQELANYKDGPNSQKKPYRIDEESLKDYAVQVGPDGSVSDAYVDTGIFDSESAGNGGFSGGKVK